MPDERKLSELVSIRSRYRRSVSLARDWNDDGSLEGYILTPSGREFLRRMAAAVSSDLAVKAWSLTGPYGSGKSAFAVYLTSLLAGGGKSHQLAAAQLKREESNIFHTLFSRGGKLAGKKRFLAILVPGSREPLHRAILSALGAALEPLEKLRPVKAILKDVKALASRSKLPTTPEIIALLERIAALADQSINRSGVVIVIDELGKFLEFAAASAEGDIFLLQAIAEFSAGSKTPVLLVTILHQSVEKYAEQLTAVRRSEWAKVHGRFEDLAFEESTEQILRLLAQAIVSTGGQDVKAMARVGAELAEKAWSIGVRGGNADKREFTRLLAELAPLHPLTAVVLGPLFRRLAQNERSLFAFLTSGEPFGFQEFLQRGTAGGGGCDVFRLDELYDYVTASLGATLFTEYRGKQWAEVESTLERLADAAPLVVRAAKTVGLLQSIGFSAGVAASKAVLRFALADKRHSADDVEAAIDELERRSVLIYRRHADSYALWEGSDIDLEAKLKEAKRRLDDRRSLAAQLAEISPLRPLVARRHSFCTGTLRYFEACFAGLDSMVEAAARDFGGADGRVIHCVPTSVDERKQMEALLVAKDEFRRPGVVAVLPEAVGDLEAACRELACLNWLRDHTPELAGDATARRELRARLAAAEKQVAAQIGRAFSSGGLGKVGARWYRGGKRVKLENSRKLHQFLSRVCDDVYSATPVWKNELANRRQLSSAAAAARRNLIEGMLERADQELLGIEGNPPERSMYDSLLRAAGLHRRQGEKWALFPPQRKTNPGLSAAWKAITTFLNSCEAQKRPVSELFAILEQPPYGLKQGVLPILLAAVMVVNDSELALYESGSFVPMLTTAVFERMLKSPKEFELQQCRVVGPRAKVFSQYAAVVSAPVGDAAVGKPQLLSIVRPLFRFVRRLPDFVSNTQQLSDAARGVLRAIKETREPDKLLFHDLPSACGARPFEAKRRIKSDELEKFFTVFRAALAELQQAYPRLQSAVEQLVLDAFKLTRPLSAGRQELAHRSKLVAELAVDPKLRAFIVRGVDASLDDEAWLETIAALLGERPTTTWTDQDRAKFEVNLAVIARKFRHFEVLAFELERSGEAALLDGDATALRIGVTLPKAEEVERVVRIPSALRVRVEETQSRIRSILAEAEFLGDSDLSVAILADMSRKLLVQHI